MKILIYTSQYPTPAKPSGAIFTHQLVKELSGQSEIRVVCPLPWFPDTSRFNVNGEWARLAKVPRSANVDEIHVDYFKYIFIPKVSGAFHPLLQLISIFPRLRALCKEEKVELINAHWIYPDGVAAVWMGRMLRIPVVLTAMGCDINLYSTYKSRKPQITWALKHAAAITTKSVALAAAVEKLGIDEEKITPIANGVNIEKFLFDENKKTEIRKTNNISQGTKYLLYVGRLSREKGIDVLIDALVLLRQMGGLRFRVLVIGDGALRNDIERSIKDNLLDDTVQLLGNRSHEFVAELMAVSDALCLPSVREGMPNVVLESLASGTPVVASNVGGVPEILTNDSGIMVPPNNKQALADGLQAVFSKTWDRDKIRNNVRNKSWSRVAAKYQDVFDRQLANRRTK